MNKASSSPPLCLRLGTWLFAVVVLGISLLGQTGCGKSDQRPSASNATASDVVGQRIDFKTEGNWEPYRLSGWSNAEAQFTWSEGTVAKLALPISANPAGLKLKLIAGALIHEPDLPSQPVEVYANSQKIAEWQVGNAAEFTAMIPGELTTAGGTLTLEFRTPKATSPKALGVNADPRVLGICVRSLELKKG
jgi:hypothetical protein